MRAPRTACALLAQAAGLPKRRVRDAAGLKPLAWALEFTCPFTGRALKFEIPA